MNEVVDSKKRKMDEPTDSDLKYPLFYLIKRECQYLVRSGRLTLLFVIFAVIGLVNPLAAKWMSWLMADSTNGAEQIAINTYGEIIMSWRQFFRNCSIGLITFLLINSDIFTKESRSGVLLTIREKGVAKYKIIIAKSIVLRILWSLCYWVSYGITYGLNYWFWDNHAVHNIRFSGVCWWLFGAFTVAVMLVCALLANTQTGVIFGTGSVVFLIYFIGRIFHVKKYTPAILNEASALFMKMAEVRPYRTGIYVTVVLTLLCTGLSILIMNKKTESED